ncbi:MAG: hypothetical protein M3457_20290 [Chloroflexota bacterium]|nr:hypothetical protein [Chloroflexota bacterium]
MRARRRNARDEVRKRSRASKEQADRQGRQSRQGIGETEQGIRLPVPGYAEDDQSSFLGVDEPVVEPEQQGSPPPATTLPSRDDDPT